VAVSGEGGTVAAGAFGVTVGANGNQGAVYVFARPADGWASETQKAKLTASDGAAGDQLGFSVAVSCDGSTVAAGAPYATVGAAVGENGSQGAVYVFARPVDGWASETQRAKLTASDGAAYNYLGFSVAVSGEGGTVAAGAFGVTVGANGDQGAVYVFARPVSGWAGETEAAKLTASDGAAGDSLGLSVAVSCNGGTVAAGAPAATVGANRDQGAAYVFRTTAVPSPTITKSHRGVSHDAAGSGQG
jgi:hypothetical protein